MRGNGIKASELIKQLQDMINKNGDREIWKRSSDYPEGVTQVEFRTKEDDGYYPTKVFVI